MIKKLIKIMSTAEKKNEVVDDQDEAVTNPQNSEQTSEEKSKKKSKRSKSEALKDQIVDLEQEVGEAKDKYLRLYAEFDNYKKRTMKERITLIGTAGRDTIAALLPVMDDFDRAKLSADDENSEEVFSEGVALVYNKLHGMLKSKGVTSMESTGEIFDPEIHEAITEIPAPNEDLKGKVIDTIEKGYLMNDTIIRHAKVVVGK